MSRQIYKMTNMAKAYGASPSKIQDNLMNYKSIKKAVATGAPYKWVLEHLKPAGQPEHIMKDLYERAKQEIWEEQEVQKTKLGKMLYV